MAEQAQRPEWPTSIFIKVSLEEKKSNYRIASAPWM